MRSDKEMLDLILETAREDDRIRAVIMNGSMVNPNTPKDIFRDFDIVYIVKDCRPFRENPSWFDRFGEIMILQRPEEMHEPPPAIDAWFTVLMQFMDGNRIDLGIYPLEMIGKLIIDSLRLVLLDKDGLVGHLDPPNESSYLPVPPTQKQYFNCCNEFWWVSPYVAKGLWRGELPYARHMLEQTLREELMKMLAWRIGIHAGFSINPGYHGKYFQKYLPHWEWEMLTRTYLDDNCDTCWDALLLMGVLFRSTALLVGVHFGYKYPLVDDNRVSAHLRHIRNLPASAAAIY